MTYRIRNIMIAFGLALVAMLLVLLYVTNYKRSVQHGDAQVPVYVAAHDISADTSGADIIAKHDLRQITIAKRTVVAGAISSPDQIRSLVLATPIYAGEQVTVRPFSDVAAQGIRAHLRGTMRAIQLSGDPNQLLASTLRTGDHVDLVANLRTDTNTNRAADKIVVRNLLVLQAPSENVAAKATGGSNSASVILAVSDTWVQRLFYAYHNGDWSLELRPVINPADGRDRVDVLETVLALQKGGQ
jgi:Flp pilus assembly protein CpaB